MIKVAAFTGGVSVPSARFRVRQYIPALKKLGVDVSEFSSLFGQYPPRQKIMRPLWACGTLLDRVPAILRSYSCDISLLQREFVSTFTTLEQLTKKPRIFDVDDAIWLYRKGGFAKKIAQASSAIICGNSFLADWFSNVNANVTVIPTAVNTQRFVPSAGVSKEVKVIGWTGTSSNFKYLYDIERALDAVLKNYPKTILRIVSDKPPAFSIISPSKIQFKQWSAENEVKYIQEMDIGLMPLDLSDWSRGKCSYKMLLYMSCGIPVIVTSVGMNTDVLNLGACGYGVLNQSDWRNALETLITDDATADRMGDVGREIVEEHFSVEIIASHLSQFLHGMK